MTCHESQCGHPENCPCGEKKPVSAFPHPAPSDEVTITGMVHIQSCPECRERFGVWVPGLISMLDDAQSIEDAKHGGQE